MLPCPVVPPLSPGTTATVALQQLQLLSLLCLLPALEACRQVERFPDRDDPGHLVDGELLLVVASDDLVADGRVLAARQVGVHGLRAENRTQC